MNRWILCVGLCAGLVACDAEKLVTVEEKANMTTVMEKGTPVATVMTIGDVEGKTTVGATIPMELRGLRVVVEELSTRSNEVIAMATATVKPPYPETLDAAFTIQCKRQFAERPVAARGTVFRELEEGNPQKIGTFATVLGSNSVRYDPTTWLDEPKLQFRFDVMSGLEEAPETMLVYAEVTVLLMPEGTDENTLDPATASVSDPAAESVLSSNPLRINFVGKAEGQ